MKQGIIILAIALVAFGVYLFLQASPDRQEGIACTMEAKLCPDGSAVGRTGPNCEFSPCPPSL